MAHRKSVLTVAAFCLAALLFPAPLPAQITFERTYGGVAGEDAFAVLQSSDSGYLLAGGTVSYGAGGADVYLVRTNAVGDTLWTRTHGGEWDDLCTSAQLTSDGGYIVAGWTLSFGVEIGGVYLVKTNASGDAVWARTITGDGGIEIQSVQQTTDDGYIMAGYSDVGCIGPTDVRLIKTNAQGIVRWQRIIGGAGNDRAYSVQPTTDGGYIVAGYTESFGAGGRDAWLIKTGPSGDTTWTRTYGRTGYEWASAVKQTEDGGYIVCGTSYAPGANASDFWLIKTDRGGDTLWTRTYGGASDEVVAGMDKTADGGYVISGRTWSFGDRTYSIYVVRVSSQGDTIWTKVFGLADQNEGNSVQQTTDGGFAIVGSTYYVHPLESQYYFIKTDSLGRVGIEEPKRPQSTSPRLQAEPNPCRGKTAISFQLTASSPARLTIVDALGRTVLSSPVSTSSFVLRTSDLPSGVYLARLDYGTQHASTRLVVQR